MWHVSINTINQNRSNTNKYKQNTYREKGLKKKLVRRLRVYVFVCICMYWCCIFDLFLMYFVCLVCISQNVSVSMRLATFGAENTSKYIQYRQIQISYIHQFYQNTYKKVDRWTGCVLPWVCATSRSCTTPSRWDGAYSPLANGTKAVDLLQTDDKKARSVILAWLCGMNKTLARTQVCGAQKRPLVRALVFQVLLRCLCRTAPDSQQEVSSHQWLGVYLIHT